MIIMFYMMLFDNNTFKTVKIRNGRRKNMRNNIFYYI